jgi:hypothetical protein
VPSLPEGAALRFLALAGTVAIVCFLAVAVAEVRRAGPKAGLFAAVPFAGAIAAGFAGRHGALLHYGLVVVTLAAALAVARRTRGLWRAVELAGVGAWIATMAAARVLFG